MLYHRHVIGIYIYMMIGTQQAVAQTLILALLPDWARRSRAVLHGSSSILLHSDVTLLWRRSSSYPAFSI